MVLSKRKVLVLLAVSVVINLVAFGFIFSNSDEVQSVEGLRTAEKQYPLLSKRILQEYPQDLLMHFFELRREVDAYADPLGADFGLYFEYLPTGTSIAVNGNDEFYAASLFKVPVIMAYYHKLEHTGGSDQEILTVQKEHIDNEFGELWKKGAGFKIKARDAVRLALTESDNTAAKVLASQVREEDFNHVYKALDIDLKADQFGALVSARNYSSILKALYFASVISKDRSEDLLDLLTKSKFSDKLVAGVPETVPVAHKIGNFNDKESREGFRDCGIVYVPRRPYVLCMFSVGDEEVAKERMKHISKLIYDFVSSEEVSPDNAKH